MTMDLFKFMDSLETEQQVVHTVKQADSFKFYISVMGINPLILLKENIEVVVDVLIMSGNLSDIKFLYKNLSDYQDFLQDYILSLNPDEINIALEYINKYQNALTKLVHVFKTKTNIDISKGDIDNNIDLSMYLVRRYHRTPYGKEVQTVLNLQPLLNMPVEDLTTILDEINFIKTAHQYMSDLDKDTLVKDYLKRDYTYTDKELYVYKLLKFPPVMTKETILKNQLITNVAPYDYISYAYKMIVNGGYIVSKIASLKSIKESKGVYWLW